MRGHRTANLGLVVAAAAAAAFAAPAAAETVVILTSGHGFAVVDTEAQTPVQEPAVHEITGLARKESIQSIDTDPTTGVLYGFTPDRLYTIDAATGVATLAGPRASEADFPIATEFDPATGLLRLVAIVKSSPSVSDRRATSARMDPRTMRLVEVDPVYAEPDSRYARTLVYAPNDPGIDSIPQIETIAHDPSESGALYGIDSARNTLVRIGEFSVVPDSDEAQLVRTVGPLTGLPAGTTVYALEITRDGTALGLTKISWHRGLCRIDLTTGEAVVLRDDLAETIGGGDDLAAAPTADLPAAPALDVRRARVRTVYGPRSPKYQSIEVRGSIPFLPDGVAGETLHVNVGGALGEFTIRRSGDAAWLGVARHASIRLNAVRLRGGGRRIDFVLRMQPHGGNDSLTGMEDAPGGLGPFASYVGLFFDDTAFFTTTQFQKVAKRL